MASSRHEGREGHTVSGSEVPKPDDRDDKDRHRRRHEHREHRHDSDRDRSHNRDRDRHRDKQSRHEHSERPREDREASHRHSSRHGQHSHREDRQRRDRDEHRHHHLGHDRNEKSSRHRTGERHTERSSSRHHRSHESSRSEKHRDHQNTQMVLHRKADHGQRDKVHDVHREAVGDSDDMLFSLDTRGDPLVWQFGSNDSRRVPSYDRFRRGRFVLGSGRRFTFNQEGSKILFSIEPDSASGGSAFRDKNNALLRRALKGPIKAKSKHGCATSKPRKNSEQSIKNDTAKTGEDDFVSLYASKKRKRDSDASSENGGSSDDSNQGDSGDDDSDASSASSDDGASAEEDNYFTVGDDARETLQKRLSELSRRVKETPQDIDAWLDLVDLQDEQSLLLGNENTDQEAAENRSKDEITGISTVKLSILESALQHNQRPSDRERLQLALMREGSKVWTSKKLAQRWADLARENTLGSGLSFSLWKARLDFEMTNLSSLTIDGIKLFITDRLRALEKDATESREDTAILANIYSQMIYIFLRATRFLYDAGFRDLAAAAWQATLESSFARPPADVKGASLGEFWDSEIQRIGEDGSLGWRSYAAKIQAGEDAEEALLDYNVQHQTLPSPDFVKLAELAHRGEFHDMDEYKPLYEAWVAAERQRADLAKLPARVIDDIDDGGFEDVFRVAVFSDFHALLFRIPDALLPDLKLLLVDAYLLFCQLPPAFGTSSWIETARNDPFLATVVLCGGSNEGKRSSKSGIQEDAAGESGRRPPDLFYDGSRLAATFHLLFSLPGWFRYLPDWLSVPKPNASEAPVPPSWIANTLRQLVRSFGLGELAPYSLAVDAMVTPASVKKAARALIKQYISNTALYEAYALAEVARDNVEVARSVLASATSNIADVEAELPLRITWAWIELENGQKDNAIRRLILRSSQDEDAAPISAETSQESQPLSPAELLRLRHELRTGMDYSLSSCFVRRATLYAQAVILLNYLSPTSPEDQQPQNQQSQQGKISAALAIATMFSEEMQSRGHGASTIHEEFLQSVARVIYFHTTHGPYRPADLQAPLEKMVALFPQNGIFLRLFAWIDPTSASGLSRLRPDNSLQKILDTVVLTRKNDCPSSRAFAIRLALQSGHGQGHAARAEFERALGGSHGSSNYNIACLGNARLWQAFVHTTAMDAMATATVTVRSDGKGVKVRGIDKKMVALAKEIYYRAVRACPGSKDVLLECFGPNTGLLATSFEVGMSPSDLRAVYQTIVSKGLRVHMDLGEVQGRARDHLYRYKK